MKTSLVGIDPKAVEFAKMIHEAVKDFELDDDIVNWMHVSGVDW